ncbi:beta-1,3-galactosyltransferase 1-like [Branchiostoma lanceolatum]|uniref:beta-1,3-galactosyltransferase 1-like n=1 Tax=Branchiostoma lanceolatum TaxID=7740 RepID=UPI0034524DCE
MPYGKGFPARMMRHFLVLVLFSLGTFMFTISLYPGSLDVSVQTENMAGDRGSNVVKNKGIYERQMERKGERFARGIKLQPEEESPREYQVGRSLKKAGSRNPESQPEVNRRYTDAVFDLDILEDPFSDNPSCPDKSELLLLILVTSAPGNVDRRKAIRSTWGNKKAGDSWRKYGDKPATCKIVFLLGKTPDNPSLNFLLEKESLEHEDMLFGDYIDSYRNLTLKVLHGFKWARDECEPEFLLKTDDDCFINTPLFLKMLQEHRPYKSDFYTGSVFEGSELAVIRDPRSKWHVSEEDHLSDFYAPYASGIGYMVSKTALGKILDVVKSVPPFPIEDAYIGTLAEKVGVVPMDSGRFSKHHGMWRTCNYLYLLVVHHVPIEDLPVTMQKVRDAPLQCRGSALHGMWD